MARSPGPYSCATGEVMPRLPKRRSDRRSHHKAPDEKVFAPGRRAVPPMPKGIEWTDATRAWWAAVWGAPWADEYSAPDRIALGRLAEMVQLFDDPKATPREKVALSTEIRLAGQAFGLDAASRRRLGWDVERPKPESAVQRLMKAGRANTADLRDALDGYD